MQLSPVLFMLFLASCLIGLVPPLLKTNLQSQFKFELQKTPLRFGVPILLGAYLLAYFLKLDAASGALFAGLGFAAAWALSGLHLAAPLAGIVLLLIGVVISGQTATLEVAQIPLLSYGLGILINQAINPQAKAETLLLPTLLCVGSYWIRLSSPENWVVPYQTLFVLSLSISVALRGLLSLSIIPEQSWIRAGFATVVAGLLGWLGIQSLLLQPGLLHWAALLAGGTLLGFLLSESDSAPKSILQGAIQLGLVGIAALVASRAFGTVGWLLLGSTVLINPKANRMASVVGLFFIVRVLLQGFIYQYNPNVTGINITHPYASAALYAGEVGMILLPNFLNLLFPKADETRPVSELLWAVPIAKGLLVAGLANFFLHSEATGSLLTALTIGGLAISLLGNIRNANCRFFPLQYALLITLGCLLTPELLQAGNNADKTDKLWGLGIALVISVSLLLASRKTALGREPVQVS